MNRCLLFVIIIVCAELSAFCSFRAKDEVLVSCDPSMVAATNSCLSECQPQIWLERWRILTDMNGDGVNEMLLSDAEEADVGGCGGWRLCIKSNECWRCIGEVYFDPAFFAMERTYDGINIWYCHPCNSMSWSMGYYSIDISKATIRKEGIFIERYDERDSIADRVYNAVFKRRDEHPYVLERSKTASDGTVSWVQVRGVF